MRLAFGVEYNGYYFCGWQTQPEKCGIQDYLENAFSKIANEDITIISSGRTDAGVHAIEQVCHFDTTASRSEISWIQGVNSLLPQWISILWINEITSNFHARHSAIEREYVYLLLNSHSKPGLNSTKYGWCDQKLSIKKMQTSSKFLLGTHDFSAFRSSICQSKSPIKTIKSIRIFNREKLIFFSFRANSYLHHMIRIIIGSLIKVGKGDKPVEWLEILIKKKKENLQPKHFLPTVYILLI